MEMSQNPVRSNFGGRRVPSNPMSNGPGVGPYPSNVPRPEVIQQAVPIPQGKIGWIVGKKGTYISQLSQKSGATIVISDSESVEYGISWKYVMLSGTGREVDKAKKLLHIRLERFPGGQTSTTEPADEDNVHGGSGSNTQSSSGPSSTRGGGSSEGMTPQSSHYGNGGGSGGGVGEYMHPPGGGIPGVGYGGGANRAGGPPGHLPPHLSGAGGSGAYAYNPGDYSPHSSNNTPHPHAPPHYGQSQYAGAAAAPPPAPGGGGYSPYSSQQGLMY